jgi:hypothetical protein
MMQLFNYRKLFTVELSHKYYREQLSPDFRFSPSEDCSRILSRYGLAFRETGYGFTVFADTGQDALLKKSISGNVRLTFLGFLVNSSFENFSDLPLEREPSERYYFSNLKVNQVNLFGSGESSLLLNKGSRVTDDDLVPLASSIRRYEESPATGSKVFSLILEPEGTVKNRQTIETSDGFLSWQHDFRDLDAGLYRLEADGTEVDRFYFSREPSAGAAYMIIEIFTKVPAGNAFIVSSNQISEKTYRIAVLNRSTYWRYRATNRNGHTLTNPAIAVGTNTGLFTGTSDLVFTSVSPMELLEEPVKGIRFLKNGSGSSTELLANLPNPDVGQILPVKSSDTWTIFSDIYIYL